MKILPQKFCFFCDLRKGVVWLSWFMMLLNIPIVVLMFLIIAQRNTIFFDHPKLESILIPMCIVEIACAFIQIFTNIFLINGVIKESHLDMLPWLLINKITITLFIITGILIGIHMGMQLPLLIYIVMVFIADHHRSILTDNDWKKLWMVAGSTNYDSKSENNIDSSDSPQFEDTEMFAHNTTVQLGGTAFLVCKVSGIDRVGANWNQISWIRRRDWHILSSGVQMYTNDERFAILHTPGSNVWTLQIKFVQRRDHGMYECQVSTASGVISHFVNLQVVVPEAFILGNGELHVDMGSTINLVCIIEKSPQPPQYVYWQKNDRMINYDDSRRDITIETSPGPRTQSRLIIREPQIGDSGNYTCSASNTEPASIYVFVSKGDNMAAISRRKTSSANCIVTCIGNPVGICISAVILISRIFLQFGLAGR